MTGAPLPRELVLASAGTGKTYHLSSRIIGLLEAGADPDEVLASTFTRKAAGEILDRVLARTAEAGLLEEKREELAREALLDGAAGTDPDAFGRAEALRLLEAMAARLHRFEVGTLDSVFVGVARSFWPELDLPPGWEIAEATAGERLRSEALQDVLEEGNGAVRVELVRMLARGEATRRVHDRLMEQVNTLHRLRRELDPESDEPWSPFRDRPRPEDPGEARRALADRLARADLPTTAEGDPDSRWSRARADLVEEVRSGDWEEVLDGGLGAKALEEAPTYHRKAPPPGLAACLEEARELAAAELGSRYDREARAMGRLATLFDEAHRRRQREEGAYRFEDLTHRLGADDGPTDREDLGYRLDRRPRHLLLDEFQDTAVPQWEALRPLARSVADRPRAESAAVVVADPKQSIYGWRGADPSLVLRVGEELDLDEDRLDRSWRSSPVVLDFVDDLFRELPSNPVLSDLDHGPEVARQWMRSFGAHRPAPPREGEAGHVRVEVGPEANTRAKAPEAMMIRAGRLVAGLRERAPRATVGVLTRTNEAVARLIGELRSRGVDASEEGGTPVRDSAPASAVLSLLQLADHPGDTVARYHVARTPLGPALGSLGDRLAFEDHEDDAAARRLSHRIRSRLVRDGYGKTLAAIRRELAPAADARQGRRLRQLVELGFRWDERAGLRPGDFVRFAESERMEDPRASAVRVMTVHQAKGLEFDAVVLPELSAGLTGGGGGGPAALPERDPDTGRVLRVFPAVKKALRPLFPEMETAHLQRQEAVLRDALSLLYVAVTRAKRAVHLLVSESSADPSSGAHTFARLALAGLGLEDEEGEDGDVLLERGDAGWHRELGEEGEGERESEASAEAGAGTEVDTEAAPAERAAAGSGALRIDPERSAGRMLRHRAPSDLAGDTARLGEVLRPDRSEPARLRGDVVHRWLEEMSWIEAGLPGDDDLRRIAARAAPSLERPEVGELLAELRGWLGAEDVRRALSREAALERGRDRLGAERVDVAAETEWPFMRRSDGEVVTGQVDRLVLFRRAGEAPSRPAAAEVLDYKTDDPGGGEEGLREAAERYRPQLEAYRRAAADLRGIAPERIRAVLVFLPAGRVVELE